MDIHLYSILGKRIYIQGDQQYKKGEEMVYV
jgi:hypothetical protein